MNPRFSETWFFHRRGHTSLPIMVNVLYILTYHVMLIDVHLQTYVRSGIGVQTMQYGYLFLW